MTVKEMLTKLKDEKIETWFDLGLFIDKFREQRATPEAEYLGYYEDFREEVKNGGIAFITFYYGVDGVTIEVEKYAKCFRNIFSEVKIHYIAGEFHPEGKDFIHETAFKHAIEEIHSFDKWPLYKDFFQTKLERGSLEYNRLIIDFWQDILTIAEKLGNYIEENRINLLYLINVCSNPGNISLSLATVLISEYMKIPVINNNHDFYWEGGSRQEDIQAGRKKPGPRDFFFKNSDIGEIFSIIEMIFPWESRSWISVNINKRQIRHMVEKSGHNPANICEIGTAVDIEKFKTVTKRSKIKSFMQIEKMLARYKNKINVFTPSEVMDGHLVKKENPQPILIGADNQTNFDFVNNNILFLQPTRIMPRKKIEVGFKLVVKLFRNKEFVNKFKSNSQLSLTILVTGPIPTGQFQYFIKLLLAFDDLLNKLPPHVRDRLFLAFLFSEFDKNKAKYLFEKPVGIPELYNIASLILLPSETEGRGLPIIEATACGIPIFCRKYYPIEVYNAVIGNHLKEKDRLRVLEFEKGLIPDKIVEKITDWVFFPQNFMGDIKHNSKTVKKRYSLKSLEKNLNAIMFRLYQQLKPNEYSSRRVEAVLNEYHSLVFGENKSLEQILDVKHFHYMPGFGRMRYMIFLKSLIDPSFFRVEEQYVRGLALRFARKLISENEYETKPDKEKIFRFYNAIDNIFRIRKGEISTRHDHAFSYRHRNKNYYPFRDFTFQELTGLINMFHSKIITARVEIKFELNPHFFTNWDLALDQLTNSSYLMIDDRERLIEHLHSNKPLCIFPGEYAVYELELFVLQTARSRLGLKIEQELNESHLKQYRKQSPMFYIFCSNKPLGKRVTAGALQNYIAGSDDEELRLLVKHGVCRIIPTEQWTVGIHFPQLGEPAIKILTRIQKQKGCLITTDEYSPIMTDMVDIDRFHIGKVKDEITSRIMGIPVNSGFIQYVPAGIRTSLAYPTPIQTAKDFHDALKSETYKKLCKEKGEEKILQAVKKDAREKGSPVKVVLERLEKGNGAKNDPVSYTFIKGLYEDKEPWSGVMARVHVNIKGKQWNFAALGGGVRKKVTEFVEAFFQETGKTIRIAWNGGYMLNAELVGKLGLPESYIGSPLGLIISDHKIVCPPLFNKPAFLVDETGYIDIKRVNLSGGFTISDGGSSVELTGENRNPDSPGTMIAFYDLMYTGRTIPGDGRTVVRLAGNIVKDVIITKPGEEVEIIPVGLTLSFPPERFPATWNEPGIELSIYIPGFEKYRYGIEAGPMLADEGTGCIDMVEEGWKTPSSIKTQAARLDFTDMRGPKIGIGIDKSDNLIVVAINGRIRESVGATHGDMAAILTGQGAVKAMGFDPGGSSTLVVDGKALNISPYNSMYEQNVYSLPPEPRPVGNAVVGWLE